MTLVGTEPLWFYSYSMRVLLDFSTLFVDIGLSWKPTHKPRKHPSWYIVTHLGIGAGDQGLYDNEHGLDIILDELSILLMHSTSPLRYNVIDSLLQ